MKPFNLNTPEEQEKHRPQANTAPLDLSPPDEVTVTATLKVFEELQAFTFDASKPVEPIPAILHLGETPVIRRGNISTLTAQSGAGKTHVLGSIMRALTTGERTLGFNGKVEGVIAYVDFEQSVDDFDHALRFQAKAGETDQIKAYHLTGSGHQQARARLEAILKHEESLEILVIDGYADCVPSVNDDKETGEFVSSLLFAAQERQIAILGVLHLNPSSDYKSRGHLGSELDRKSETVLQINQTKEIRELFTSKARKKPIHKGQGVRFEWSDDAKGFVEIEGTSAEVKKADKVEGWKRILLSIQAETGMLAWKHCDLYRAIMIAEGIKDRAAKNRITEWVKCKLLTHSSTTGVYTSTLSSAKGDE